jgi:NADH-quinone oxidoreductase subunit A
MSEYGKILWFLLAGLVMSGAGLFVSKLIRPNRPNPVKNSTYECGEETVGTTDIRFNVRFYVTALIFLIFDVEILFLLPWSMVFADPEIIKIYPQWGWMSFGEMTFFIVILTLGLAYSWQMNDLGWIKSTPLVLESDNPVPDHLYQQLNTKYQSKANEK